MAHDTLKNTRLGPPRSFTAEEIIGIREQIEAAKKARAQLRAAMRELPTVASLAEEYGVTRAMICLITHGNRYADIAGPIQPPTRPRTRTRKKDQPK